MVGFGKRMDGPGGRRTAQRTPAYKAAGFMTREQSRVGYLLDVSSTGAKLDGSGNLSVGQDIWLKLGIIETLATVVWSKANCCGVRFDVPLSDVDVRHLAQAPQGAMFARLSQEEKLGAADWLNGLIR